MYDSNGLDEIQRGTICIEDIEIGMTRHLRKVID
ncbi:MAG: (R)-hydratase, partial [Pseudomonadota bacterium]